MAYFCFTVITYRYGSRSAASKALSIDEAVLKKLSELSTNRGDNSMARKMTAELTPLTYSALVERLFGATRRRAQRPFRSRKQRRLLARRQGDREGQQRRHSAPVERLFGATLGRTQRSFRRSELRCLLPKRQVRCDREHRQNGTTLGRIFRPPG
jgi:hypothetical protein